MLGKMPLNQSFLNQSLPSFKQAKKKWSIKQKVDWWHGCPRATSLREMRNVPHL